MAILDGDIVLHWRETRDSENSHVVIIPSRSWSFLGEGPCKAIVDEEVHIVHGIWSDNSVVECADNIYSCS